MLACVCLNPSFDRTVSLRSFTAGDVNRVLSARQDVGGKGINVAITARRLGIASCVLGCAGKNGIDAVRRKLDGEQVTHAFLLVDGDVRTNMKIVPQDGTGVTELNEPGAPVNAANQRAFSDLLAEKTVAGQYVVLTGSLPPECPPEYYRDLMLSLPERLFVLDVSGAALMAGLTARPFLVKPNRSELQAAMNRPLPTMADVHQAALELLDPESPEYAFDLVSMVEATLEDPRQVLRAQERKARDAAMAEMKMDGVDYDERLERIAEVTYPKPLEDLLDAAFDKYCDAVPWARDYCLRPKSVLRDMLESAADFKGYIQKLGIMRYEGILLRYLSEAFRGLDRTIPEDKRTEQLKDIIAWLGLVVRSVDSSLVDEWENAGSVLDAAPPGAAGAEAVVHDRRGLTVLVRNALFSRVRMAAHRDIAGLGEADGEWGFGERAWAQALDEYYEAHEEILLDADARSKAYLILNEADEEEAHVWHVRQIFHDEDGDNDFAIAADVDLDATQVGDGVVFKDYRVGFAEDLLGEW